jgi:hypothetical protein
MDRICTEAMTYRGVPVGVGQTFDVDPQDVPILLLTCRIDPLDGEQGYSRGPIGPIPMTREMVAQQDTQPRRGRYARKAI